MKVKKQRQEMRLCVLLFALAIQLALCHLSTFPEMTIFHVVTFPVFGALLFILLRLYHNSLPLFKQEEPHIFKSPRHAYDYGKQNEERT